MEFKLVMYMNIDALKNVTFPVKLKLKTYRPSNDAHLLSNF